MCILNALDWPLSLSMIWSPCPFPSNTSLYEFPSVCRTSHIPSFFIFVCAAFSPTTSTLLLLLESLLIIKGNCIDPKGTGKKKKLNLSLESCEECGWQKGNGEGRFLECGEAGMANTLEALLWSRMRERSKTKSAASPGKVKQNKKPNACNAQVYTRDPGSLAFWESPLPMTQEKESCLKELCGPWKGSGAGYTL